MTQTAPTTEIDPLTGLAIEVIGRTGSIAVMCGPRVVWATVFGDQVGAAASIGSALRAASEHVRLTQSSLSDLSKPEPNPIPSLDFVGVAAGPGSFTGLRIAVTAANALAYAAGVPVIDVDSLAAIAAAAEDAESNPGDSLQHQSSPLLVGLNAYRGQVFACQFPAGLSAIERQTHATDLVHGSQLLSAADWDQRLASCDRSIRFAGDHALFAKTVSNADRGGVWQSSACWAIGVGRIGIEIYQRKNAHPQSFTAVLPRYFRPSAAEEQMDLS
jgi:tRNA threonylcarbamoyladenosine biosynthesis protein TsaB